MKISSLDIVSSALNEDACIEEFLNRLEKVMRIIPRVAYRVIIIDNGSTDETWQKIVRKSKEKPFVTGIQMSRTFSFDAALTCGLDHANAECVVLMASDLQDPPEIIPQLLEEMKKGYDQVVVNISKRDSVPLPRRLLSRIFYRFANSMTRGLIPQNVSDFRIMNRDMYIALRSLRESHRFLRGLGAWVGFNTGVVTIERPPRFAGKSKWLSGSVWQAVNQGLQGVFAHSTRLLQWLSSISFIVSALALLSLPLLIFFWFTNGVPFAGFGWLLTLTILFFAVVMITLATISLFIALIYEEVKERPLYIVKQIVTKGTAKTN